MKEFMKTTKFLTKKEFLNEKPDGQREEMEEAIKARETLSYTRMHTFRGAILCRGIHCEVEFLLRRKDQVFCSPACRLNYFTAARSIGLILLEKSKHDSSLKVIVDCLLEILKTSGQAEETE